MKTMDNALMELLEKGWIAATEAYLQANNKHMFKSARDLELEQGKDID
jgi:Tfp pilus assembly ATPase PilU